MFAGDYCNRDIAIIGKTDSIFTASQLMRDHHVSDVLVVDSSNGENTPIGILTDRDIIVNVVADGIDLNVVTIEDIMSYKLITARESDDLLVTIKRMRLNGKSRLPIVNHRGGLIGILSIDAILHLITEQMIDIGQIIANEKNCEKEAQPRRLIDTPI